MKQLLAPERHSCGGAAAFVLAAAFAATLLPTRRALRVDPTVTLRYE
jgi:ABC-type lipoprotein release transport system permease subunit